MNHFPLRIGSYVLFKPSMSNPECCPDHEDEVQVGPCLASCPRVLSRALALLVLRRDGAGSEDIVTN